MLSQDLTDGAHSTFSNSQIDVSTRSASACREYTQFGDRLKSIEDSIAALASEVRSIDACDVQAQLEHVTNRVQRMEMLLLRTPIEDFKVLDDAIAEILPYKPSDATCRIGKDVKLGGFDISINPEYLDQFCIEADDDGKIDNVAIDITDAHKRCCSDRAKPRECLRGVEGVIRDCKYNEHVLVEDAEEGLHQEVQARVETGEIDIDDLTTAEAKHFQLELNEGACSLWEPWWRTRELVDSPTAAACSKPTPHICCANGKNPHASVAFASLSTVYAYVHAMRASNGGWEWEPLEAGPHILALCPVVSSHHVYKSTQECVHASLDSASKLARGGFGRDFDLKCFNDVRLLVDAGVASCTRALQEVENIFESCLAGGGNSGKMKRAIKKVQFLTSFAVHHYELLHPVARIANDYAEGQSSQPHREQVARGNKVLGKMTSLEMD